jgi:ribosome maturation factor RimP
VERLKVKMLEARIMEQSDRVTAIARHAAPLAAVLGIAVWGIEIAGGVRPVARLYVEAPSPVPEDRNEAVLGGAGVDIEQCAELSRRLGLALEVDDLFPGAWTLEVSSPGFARPFFQVSQLPPYVGREIELTLAAPLAGWPGRKNFRGVLCAVDGEQATLRLDASRRLPDDPDLVDVPWNCVRKAHLVHIFEDPERPGKKKSGPAHGTGSQAMTLQCPGGRHEP